MEAALNAKLAVCTQSHHHAGQTPSHIDGAPPSGIESTRCFVTGCEGTRTVTTAQLLECMDGSCCCAVLLPKPTKAACYLDVQRGPNESACLLDSWLAGGLCHRLQAFHIHQWRQGVRASGFEMAERG
jgi:hypothetical protein